MEKIQNLTNNELYELIEILNEQKNRFLRHKLGIEQIKTLETDLALADYLCELLNNEIRERTKNEIKRTFTKK